MILKCCLSYNCQCSFWSLYLVDISLRRTLNYQVHFVQLTSLFWRRQNWAQERQNKCCEHSVESQFVTKPWVCGCPPKLEHYSHMMTYKAGWRAYILSKGKEMHSRHRDCVGPTHPPTQSPPQRLLSPTFVWKQISTGAYGFPPAHMDFIQHMWISTNAYGFQPTSTLRF